MPWIKRPRECGLRLSILEDLSATTISRISRKLAADLLQIAQCVVFDSIDACSLAAVGGSRRANSEKPLRRPSGLHRRLGRDGDESVERKLARLYARERRPRDLDRRNLLIANHRSQLGC